MLSLRQIPVKNLKAHPVRTVILILLTAAQIISILIGSSVSRKLQQELDLALERLGADIIIYPTAAMSRISGSKVLMQGTPAAVYRPVNILSRLADCEGIDRTSRQIYIRAERSDGSMVWIAGIEPETDFVITPWLSGQNRDVFSEGITAGCNAALTEEKSVSLFGTEWNISARLLPTGSELDDMLFVSMTTLSAMLNAAQDSGIETYKGIDTDNSFSAMLIRVDHKGMAESAANWINIYIRKVNAIRSEETLSASAAGIRGQMQIIFIISAAVWLTLLAAVFIVHSMLMQERRKEIFVWETIGASGRIISRIMMRESFLTTIAGIAAGIVLFIPFQLISAHKIGSGTVTFPAEFVPVIFLTAAVTLAAGCLSSALIIRMELHKKDV